MYVVCTGLISLKRGHLRHHGSRASEIYTANGSPCTMPRPYILPATPRQGRDRREDVKKRAKNSGDWVRGTHGPNKLQNCAHVARIAEKSGRNISSEKNCTSLQHLFLLTCPSMRSRACLLKRQPRRYGGLRTRGCNP